MWSKIGSEPPGSGPSTTSQPPSDYPEGAQRAPRWLTTAEFCAHYHVSPLTARRWARQGRVKAVRVPPCEKGQLRILDPEWDLIDVANLRTPYSPAEWLCVLRQCDVASLLGITRGTLKYLESAGKTNFRLVGSRKRYSLAEVRRLLAVCQAGRQQPTASGGSQRSNKPGRS